MASTTSLNKLAVNGAFWTVLGYGASNGLRFIGNLILTRLLAPELFGLMALMNTFLIGLALFSDIGIGPSIVQNKRGQDPIFLNTAWTLQAIRGLCLWVICCILSYPVSRYYGDARILMIMPILGLSSLMAGFNSTSLMLLKREMNLRTSTLLELAIQVLSLTIMVSWAYFQPTIWALVAGTMISVALKLILSHFWLPGVRNQFAWDKTCAQELFRFGRWIFLSTAFTFLAMQSDRLIVGKIVSIEMLGIYTVCLSLSDLPRQVVTTLGSNVIFPIIAKSADTPRSELRRNFLKKRWVLLMGAAVFASILIAGGDLLVKFLYDSRYSQDAWILTVLAIGFWHTVLYDTMNSCLLGLGKPYYGTTGYMIRFLILILGVPAAYNVAGFEAAVFVIAFHDLPMYVVISYGAVREKFNNLNQDLMATGVFLLILAAAIGIRVACGFGFPLEHLFHSAAM
ncbi:MULTISPECIES: oligosaccharide flippase family protein [unclassified Leptolyngbya]|uniref:oligosaccharide flippase family protein n=1 Tax=unclassified Leptolyngbya TaxID=2650499 RepID=UPI001681E6A7|nr:MULTISPECIES: oligosaccharide flippase family protein [unclassified Leptolyngbya]MBD1912804.1 oligosaccharide flippase family protein [Leptolyngbya sp. FACHB-8]MBD2157751.1 oligosaccharide flippase family protein [Leptolyngbya sp. FACHB-16]